MTVVLASDNKGKINEFAKLLAGTGIEIISKRSAGYMDEIAETGDTFEENAYIKAAFVSNSTGMPALADDSGLCVDALNGAPGLYSARFSGNHADSDEKRCELLLHHMVGENNREARFICSLCCVFPNGDVLRANGSCEGTILNSMLGDNGFGYDPIFCPTGFSGSMAQLSEEEKNSISHRGKAIEQFKIKWENYFNDQQ